jgi:anti-sigma regulatory factor (Ser/Thr protein kinase)
MPASRLGKSDDVGNEGPPTPQERLLDVVLPASVTAPGVSRRRLEEHDALAQSRRLDDVKLLVSELVTNAVRHAPHEPGDTVRLSVRMEGELVHVEVCDRGPGFERPALGKRLADESGWGLYLLQRLSARWGTESNDHWCVWFEIDPG